MGRVTHILNHFTEGFLFWAAKFVCGARNRSAIKGSCLDIR